MSEFLYRNWNGTPASWSWGGWYPPPGQEWSSWHTGRPWWATRTNDPCPSPWQYETTAPKVEPEPPLPQPCPYCGRVDEETEPEPEVIFLHDWDEYDYSVRILSDGKVEDRSTGDTEWKVLGTSSMTLAKLGPAFAELWRENRELRRYMEAEELSRYMATPGPLG